MVRDNITFPALIVVHYFESLFYVQWCNAFGTEFCKLDLSQYKIPRVVIGENKTFLGEEELLASRGVEVIVGEDKTCYDLMQAFIKRQPEEWNEDIGEE